MLLLADHPQHLGSVKRGVRNLGLEWDLLQYGQVQIFHFDKFGDCLYRILESEYRILGYVAEITHQQSLIFAKVLWKLISELESFVKLDFGNYVGCDDWKRKNVGKVLG